MSQAAVRGLREAAVERFLSTDWTFAAARTNAGLHGIHPYPAKFIPQVPGQLLDIFHPVTGGSVLDPFCGSGTTLLECQARGIPSVGIDLNPIATLVSRVKLFPPETPIDPLAVQIVARATREGPIALPDIPRLDHWFTPGSATALAKLTRYIAEVAEPHIRDALHVALSRIIVKVSRQESDTRYAAVHRAIEEPDVYTAFVEAARTLDAAFGTARAALFPTPSSSRVATMDILQATPEDLGHGFGMIITSPPYPNAYEYWLYHKYRMYWLGEDPIAVRSSEIGARPHYFKKNPATPEDFLRQMTTCFGLFRSITLPTALVCVVVGRSVIRGQTIDNAALVSGAATTHGFRQLGSIQRRIPSTRKTFNPAHGSINDETLLVFERG